MNPSIDVESPVIAFLMGRFLPAGGTPDRKPPSTRTTRIRIAHEG